MNAMTSSPLNGHLAGLTLSFEQAIARERAGWSGSLGDVLKSALFATLHWNIKTTGLGLLGLVAATGRDPLVFLDLPDV